MANRLVETIYSLKDKTSGKLREISAKFLKSAGDAELFGRRSDKAFSNQSGIVSFSRKISRLRFSLLGIAAPIATVVASLRKVANAASIQADAEARLATNLRNSSGATKEQIEALKDQASALQDVTGFGDETTISAQALLATFGLTAEEVGKLTPRLLDAAVGMQKTTGQAVPLESIATAVGKAFSDGIGALSRYGVTLSATDKAAFATATQQEKLLIVTRALDANYKGLAETLGDRFTGKVNKASGAFGDFQEALGKSVINNKAVLLFFEDLKTSFVSMSESVTSKGTGVAAIVTYIVETVRRSGSVIKATFNAITSSVATVVVVIAGFIEGISGAIVAVQEFFGIIPEGTKKLQLFAQSLRETADKQVKQDWIDFGDAVGSTVGSIGRVADAFSGAGIAAKELTKEQQALQDAQAKSTLEAKKQAAKLEELSANAKTLGLDYQQLATGIDSATAAQIAAVQRFAEEQKNGELNQRAFTEVLQASIDKVGENIPAIDALGDALKSLSTKYPNANIDAFIDKLAKQKQAAKDADRDLLTLGKAAKNLNEDYKELSGGVSESTRTLIDSFKALASEGDISKKKLEGLFDNLIDDISGNNAAIDTMRKNLASIKDAIPTDLYNKFNVQLSENTEESLKNAKSQEEIIAKGKEIVAGQKDVGEAAQKAGKDQADASKQVVQEVAGATKAISDLFASWRGISEEVDNRTEFIVKKLTTRGKSVQKFFDELAREFTKLNREYTEQEAKAAELIALYESMPDSFDEFSRLARGALTQLDLVSEGTRKKLQSLVKEGQSALDSFNESAIASAEAAEKRLRELTLDPEEIAELETKARKDQLEQQLADAKLMYNTKGAEALQREIDALAEIDKAQDKQRQESLAKDRQAAQEKSEILNNEDQNFDPEVTNNSVVIEKLYALGESPIDERELGDLLIRILDERGRFTQ